MSSVLYTHQALLGAGKGAWVEHKEYTVGRESPESYWTKAGVWHLPLHASCSTEAGQAYKHCI